MRSAACTADAAGSFGGGAGAAERGATIVEFLAVAVLAVVALLGVAQLAVWMWARDVAVNAAHEGARTAAEAGRPLDDGVSRARVLLRDGLGGAGGAFAVEAGESGQEVEVSARGDAPAILPFLPRFTVTVSAHAFDEDAVVP